MCVAKSDHHCELIIKLIVVFVYYIIKYFQFLYLGSWINNCVGLKNHRYFLLFLYATVQICFYGAYLIYYIFLGLAKKMNLTEAWITSVQTGRRVKISTYQA